MASQEASYEFGDVRVDAVSELVSRSGTPVLLEPKAFELLAYSARRYPFEVKALAMRSRGVRE